MRDMSINSENYGSSEYEIKMMVLRSLASSNLSTCPQASWIQTGEDLPKKVGAGQILVGANF